ncbi:hypothetical protein Mgra_00003051 [Meloidogyne graminicola]|uniref:Glucuronosyltransferase n=1 Tax=Meloidogyne graminicola TaxID=189291 RepID=A0A8S9ZVD4_9BILA|nr:hypothetical protein Mgra_00003051 [Meloidogyne graminicola]
MLFRPLFFLLWILTLSKAMMHGQSSNTEIKKKALFITTNHNLMHFEMNVIFADILTNRLNVHLLILNTKNENVSNYKFKNTNFCKHNNTKYNCENIFQFINFPENFMEESSSIEHNKKILEKEAVENNQLFENLTNENFEYGFFDICDIGALLIFEMVIIKNVFGINNTQLNSYQFKYVGKEFPIKVPEIYSTKINDSDLVLLNHQNHYQEKRIKNDYEINVHNKLDKLSYPFTIENLYKKIKGIFINGDQIFDFPLEDSLPENVFYVGGFHLDINLKKKMISNNIEQNNIILLSIDNCQKENILNEFLEN